MKTRTLHYKITCDECGKTVFDHTYTGSAREIFPVTHPPTSVRFGIDLCRACDTELSAAYEKMKAAHARTP